MQHSYFLQENLIILLLLRHCKDTDSFAYVKASGIVVLLLIFIMH